MKRHIKKIYNKLNKDMFQVFLDVNRHQENYIEDINSILYGNKYRKNNLRYGSSLKA